MTEIWKPYPSKPTYKVSNLGRVIGPRGLLKLTLQSTGYYTVHVYFGKNIHRITFVHRMVLETFVGPCPDKFEACHNDGNRTNNSLDNLRWDSRQSNTKDRLKHGTGTAGEKVHTAKLTEDQVREIRRNPPADYTSRVELATMYGVDQNTIWYVETFRSWKHVK